MRSVRMMAGVVSLVVLVMCATPAAQDTTDAAFMRTVMELLLEMQSDHATEVAELRAQIEALSSFGGRTATFNWSHGDGPVRMIPANEGHLLY